MGAESPKVGAFDAIVLAGGRGSRLGGVDKGALVFDGDTLLAHTLRAVAEASRVIVVGEVEAPGAIVVQESPRFGGPAAAIGAGLSQVTAPYVLVVACDQPFLAEGLPALLNAPTGDGAIAIDGDGRRQHLMAVLEAEALQASAAVHPTLANLSVRALLAPLDLHEVAVPERSTFDIDTWHDHDCALKRGQEGALHD